MGFGDKQAICNGAVALQIVFLKHGTSLKEKEGEQPLTQRVDKQIAQEEGELESSNDASHLQLASSVCF